MPRDDYRRLHRLLDRATPRVRRQVLGGLQALQAVFTLAELERLVAAGNVFQIARALALAESVLSPAAQSLRDVYRSGMALGEATLPRDVRAILRFDARDVFAEASAQQHAARFVTEVSRETRRNLQQLITQGFTEQIPPRALARLLRESIGLTRRQRIALANRRRQLVREGLSADRVQAATDRYARRLLNQRATTIARTETMRALTDGQQTTWQRAQQQGLLGPARKVWITTPDDRLCPICAPLEGAQADLNGLFQTSVGSVTGPPAHPNCRCSQGLVVQAVPRRRAA